MDDKKQSWDSTWLKLWSFFWSTVLRHLAVPNSDKKCKRASALDFELPQHLVVSLNKGIPI